MSSSSFEASEDPFIAAKTEAAVLIRRAKLVSPKIAMYASGSDKDLQTLWSIALRTAMAHDVSAEDVHIFLEKCYPQYSLRHADRSLTFVW